MKKRPVIFICLMFVIVGCNNQSETAKKRATELPKDNAGGNNLLPSWNDGSTKKSIIEFVTKTTDTASMILCLSPTALPALTMMVRYGVSNPFTFN